VNADESAPESVHLADWPEADEALMDEELSRRMEAARRIVALGRAARNAAAIKTRQPLREVVVVPEAAEGAPGFREGVKSLTEIVLDELNVKELRFGEAEDILAYELKPNLSVVGPKYGKLVPVLRRALAEAPTEVGARAAAGEEVPVSVDGQEVVLGPEE
jgi:isoleucyl-tRNA synthetase